jgi:hypothetical protein
MDAAPTPGRPRCYVRGKGRTGLAGCRPGK